MIAPLGNGKPDPPDSARQRNGVTAYEALVGGAQYYLRG